MAKKKIVVGLSVLLSMAVLFASLNIVFFTNKTNAVEGGDITYRVPMVNNISIDGNLSDWKNIKEYSVTKSVVGYTLENPWTVKIAWDGIDTLYLNTNSTYPPGVGPYISRPKDSPTWYEDDIVALLIAKGDPIDNGDLFSDCRFYGWNSKQNFVAEEAGGRKVLAAKKSAWISNEKGYWSLEASIKLSDNIVERIKDIKYVNMSVVSSCASGGEELSFLGNLGGRTEDELIDDYYTIPQRKKISEILDIDLINKFVFSTELEPTPTIAPTPTPIISIPITKLKSIKLNKKKINLAPKKKVVLKATITPTNATNKKVKWSVKNKKIAKVNSKGKVTALRTGKTTVVAKAADGTGKKATCTVVVKKAKKKK